MAETAPAADAPARHWTAILANESRATVYLNRFASALEPLDLTTSEEFVSLLRSADDLGIAYQVPVRYCSRNVVVNGLRFHVLEWGDPGKPALVLLHGGNQTAHSWDLVSLHLADRFHVVAIDQRGHGDSEWPRDCEASFSQMSDDAALIIESLDLDEPALMGHSMGGLVALKLLAKSPTIASKAVIVDVGPEVSADGGKTVGNFVRSLGEYDSLDQFVETVTRYDPYRTRAHIERTARYNLLERADGKFVSKHDTRRRQLRDVREALVADWPRADELTALALPVLVIRGAQSPVLPADLAERFVAALPTARLVTVDDAGHNVQSQNTQGFLAAVVPFLTERNGE